MQSRRWRAATLGMLVASSAGCTTEELLRLHVLSESLESSSRTAQEDRFPPDRSVESEATVLLGETVCGPLGPDWDHVEAHLRGSGSTADRGSSRALATVVALGGRHTPGSTVLDALRSRAASCGATDVIDVVVQRDPGGRLEVTGIAVARPPPSPPPAR